MNLDNRKEAQPTVQVSREITTTNGCKVTLTFAEKEDPNLQHDVAEMLLAAFIKRRSMLYEASALPVQSVYQRTQCSRRSHPSSSTSAMQKSRALTAIGPADQA